MKSEHLEFLELRYDRKLLCYRNFLSITQVLIQELQTGKLDLLEETNRKRKTLIQVIEKIDLEIKSLNLDFQTLSRPETFKQINGIVTQILETDKTLTQVLTKLKSDTFSKLSEISHGKKSMQGYRSPMENIENEELRKKIGTEA